MNFWLLLWDHTGGSARGEEGRSERGHHPTTVRVCAASDGAYCEVKYGILGKYLNYFMKSIIILLCVYIKFPNLLNDNI